jgi:hypothetical protein
MKSTDKKVIPAIMIKNNSQHFFSFILQVTVEEGEPISV